MRGRLTRLFILFIFLSTFSYQKLFSQQLNPYLSLPVKEQKAIKKHIKLMRDEDKILSFTCLNPKASAEYSSKIAGIFYNHQDDWLSDPPLLTILNLSTVNTFHSLPFPAARTRERSKTPYPSWLHKLFNVNYIIDINNPTSNILYYGLDSVRLTNSIIYRSYSSFDNLVAAVLKHDLIYFPDNPNSLVQYLQRIKIKGGDKKQLDEKLRQKLAVKKADNNKNRNSNVDTEVVLQWIWEVYRTSMDIEKSKSILPLPLSAGTSICSYSFTPNNFEKFNSTLEKYLTGAQYHASGNLKSDLNLLANYNMVVIPVSDLTKDEITFIEQVNATATVLLVDFNALTDTVSTMFTLHKNLHIISVPENNGLAQSVAAQELFDYTYSSAPTLRIGVPELVGLNPDTLANIDKIVSEAIAARATPGCQVLVAKDGYVIWNKAYGYQTYDSLTLINENTLFDLASITKVLATTQGMMYLLDHNEIDLDVPLSNYLPYLIGTNKENISSRQVLAHQAGLYPYYPFWKKAKKELLQGNTEYPKTIQAGRSLWVSSSVADSILLWAAKSDLLAERIDTITHEQYFYSDIGFYFLKDLIEKKTGRPLDDFLTEKLYKPMGTNLRFKPTCYFPIENIAPTEIDMNLRHEQLQGFVHDRNAALMGGVAGQAGLFGNANDVAKILQLQLNMGAYGGKRYFTSATVKQFLSRQYDNNRRALGWDEPGTEPDGPVSTLASSETFGHSGFTGGSIWADPKENIIFVFLSNRVYPSAENTKLVEMNIRTRIQDLVYRSIIKSK